MSFMVSLRAWIARRILGQGYTAIDDDGLPRHIAGMIAHEEEDGPGDVLRLCETPHGNERFHRPDELRIIHGSGTLGHDMARFNTVDPYAVLGKLERGSADEAVDAALACR